MNISFKFAKRVSVLLTAAIAFAACAPAPNASAEEQEQAGRYQVGFPVTGPDAVMLDGLETGTLENGMRYAIFPYDFPADAVSIEMFVEAGSFDEASGTFGIAHFLEHMAFNGSENIKEDELVDLLSEKGLSIGGFVNASTDYDATRYSFALPNNSEDLLNTAFFVLSEMAGKLVFNDEAIDRERGIIRAELRGRLGIGFDQNSAQEAFFYPDLLRTRRSPIGSTQDINSVTREDFERFYETYYRPEHTLITVVGPVDPDVIKSKLEDAFADWEAKGKPVALPNFGSVDFNRVGKTEQFYNPDLTANSVTLKWLSPSDLPSANARPALRERLVHRLAQSLFEIRYGEYYLQRQEDGVDEESASIEYVYNPNIDGVASELSIQVWPSDVDGSLEDAVRNVAHLQSYLLAEGVSDEYLDRLKQDFINWQKEEVSLSGQWSSFDYTSLIANDLVFGSTPQAQSDILAQLEATVASITANEIVEAFKRHYPVDKAPLVFVAVNEQAEGVGQKALDAWTDAKAQPEAAYADFKIEPQETNTQQVGEFAYDNIKEAAALISSDYVEDIDVHRFAFENNVKLNVTTKTFGRDNATISIRFGRGTLEPDYVNAAGMKTLLESTFIGGGVEAHTANQLIGIFPGLQEVGGLLVEKDAFVFSASVNPENIADQIKVMTAYFLAPAWREKSFEDFQSFYTDTSQEDAFSEYPEFVMSEQVQYLICPSDPLCQTPSPADYASLTLDDAKKSIQRALQRGHIEIAIIGDVDVEAVQSAVGQTFGNLPERDAQPLNVSRERAFGEGQLEPFVYKHNGSGERAMVSVIWPTPDGIEAYRARKMRVVREVFYRRVFLELREAEGLTYSPAVGGEFSDIYKDYGYINVEADVNLKDLKTATDVIIAMGNNMHLGNISEDEFQDVKTQYTETARTVIENRDVIDELLANLQGSPSSLQDLRGTVADYERMTLDEVNTLAREMFSIKDAKIIHVIPN